MKNKSGNTKALFWIFVILIISGWFVFSSADGRAKNIPDSSRSLGELQKITLSTQNYNYYPNIIKVKSNQPVEITLDESVRGCLRAFTIKDFGVSQVSSNPSEKITFTPTKKGTFKFACSMGMAYGTIIVE